MRKVILLFLFISNLVFAQTKNDSISNIIGFYPSKLKIINGVTIKYWDNDNPNHAITKSNGLRLGLNPLGLFTPFITVIHSIDFIGKDEMTMQNTDELEALIAEKSNVVNGIDLSLLNMEKTHINGLEINFSGGFGTKVNGLSMAPLNAHAKINGIELGVIANVSYKCNGIQIGIYNNCQNLKGIQIGLWNKNQSRSLPIINFSF